MAKPRDRTPRALSVGILVDQWGGGGKTGDEEYADHVKVFGKILSPCRCTFEQMRYPNEQAAKDLIVFDYGGMSVGNDLLSSNSRALIRWAQDHPSSLLLIASRFTWRNGFREELIEMGLLDDVYEGYDDKPRLPPSMPNVRTFNYFMDLELQNEIRAWFGLQRRKTLVERPFLT